MTGYSAEEVLGRNCRFLQGSGYPAVALYMIGMAVVTIVAVYLATETYKRNLSGGDQNEEQEVAGNRVVRG